MKPNKESQSNINDLLFSQPESKTTGKGTNYINTKNPSIAIALRLKLSDKQALEKHFKLKGILNLSTGLRQVIAKYMQDNNLL
jgi:hypothetical protein